MNLIFNVVMMEVYVCVCVCVDTSPSHEEEELPTEGGGVGIVSSHPGLLPQNQAHFITHLQQQGHPLGGGDVVGGYVVVGVHHVLAVLVKGSSGSVCTSSKDVVAELVHSSHGSREDAWTRGEQHGD